MIQQPHNEFEKYLQKVKIKYLKGNTFLEIGCGDCSVFKDTSFVVDGYDIDSEVIKSCDHYRKVSTNLDDFDISSYDSVCLLGVLEHMEDSEIIELLLKLKDSKNIYITVPNGESFHRGIGVNLGIISNKLDLGSQDYEIGHRRYYDYKILLKTFHEFSIINRFDIDFIGTAGFKFDTSHEMVNFLDKIRAIEKEAEDSFLIGPYSFKGAELIMNLKKNG